MADFTDSLSALAETDPVELVEVDDMGDEPPGEWDPYGHEENDRADGVVVTDEEVTS